MNRYGIIQSLNTEAKLYFLTIGQKEAFYMSKTFFDIERKRRRSDPVL